MAASEVDPFFWGSLISGLTGEVVAFFDARFTATFYRPTAFYGDRLKGKPVAIGSAGLMETILSSTRPWPKAAWVKGGRRELPVELLCRDWVDSL